jgi:hypothetical protein
MLVTLLRKIELPGNVQTCRDWAPSVAGQPAATMDTRPVMLVLEAEVTGEKPRSPVELYDVLRTCWSTATGGKWSPSNPAQGQCSVTALVVQDVLGGILAHQTRFQQMKRSTP